MHLLPLAYETDVLIAGGGVCALPIAERYASLGFRVLVIDASTYLCHEICRTMRLFVPASRANQATAGHYFPGAYRPERLCGSEVPLHPDMVRRGAEDYLISRGIRILYNLQLCSCDQTPDGWSVIVGGKGGLFHAQVRFLIDCTENNITADLLPDELRTDALTPVYRNQSVTRCIEFTGITGEPTGELTVPISYRKQCGDRVSLHPGAHATDHGYVEIRVNCSDALCRGLHGDMAIEYQARRISLELCAQLVQQTGSLRQAQICLAAKQVSRLASPDALALLRQAEKLALTLAEASEFNTTCLCVHNRRTGNGTDARRLPDLATDIVVAGGGPAGAPAAFAAASQGAAVHLYDLNDELGGAGTAGAIRWYWFGLRRGFTKIIDQRTRLWEDNLGWKRSHYVWGTEDGWASELKAMALWDLCREAGAGVNLGCCVVDAITTGDAVSGVLISTPYGLLTQRCSVTIDCTGDGDVAASAGVPYVYGNQRDRMTLWAAYAPLKAPMHYAGDFSTTAAADDPLDRTRFILAERRRSGISGGVPFDHAEYLTPRESRHMTGVCTIDLADQLLQRRYPDTIAVAFSNNDPKGISTADLMNIGLLPPNLLIHVPYRCLLPRQVDGLLVACRALSCTHDANCAVRMQDDMQAIGGAAGFAAALCIEYGLKPREIPIDKLQARLLALGNLTEQDLQSGSEPIIGLADAVNLVANGNGMQWGWQNVHEKTLEPVPVAAICCAPAAAAVPLLLGAREDAANEAACLLIDRLLVYHGSEAGLTGVLDKIMTDLHAGLPRQLNGKARQILPDHNRMPETAFLLHSLGFCQSMRIMAAFTRLTDLLATSVLDFCDNTQGLFYYFHSVAYVAERVCFAEFKPLLRRLIALLPPPEPGDTDNYEVYVLPERLAYLALVLNRALARCGAKDGYVGMLAFLADKRALLRRCALDELKCLLRQDFGYDRAQWFQSIESADSLSIQPWCERIF